MATCEVVNGTLVVQGNLDKASDPDFQSTLEKYCATAEGERVLDLTSVRWLNNTIAKIIINSATDVLDKGARMRVISSRHVQQTLSLLNAQTYMTIEQGAKPAAPAAAPAESADAPKPVELLGLDDADLVLPGAGSPPAAAAPATTPPAGAETATPAPKPAAAAPAAPAAPRPTGMALPQEELSRGAVLFRVLQVDRRYSFIINGQEVVGTVRERLGGSWVLVEATGRRKILNLDVVEMVEVL